MQTVQQKFTQAENHFGDEARKQGVPEATIAKLIDILSSGKGSHPFMIEAGHSPVKLNEGMNNLVPIDMDGNHTSKNPGIQNSLRLGALAHNLRTTKGRTAQLVISISNLYHTQGSPENRKKTESLADIGGVPTQIFRDIFDGGSPVIMPPETDISLVTQSEATRKGRNRINTLLDRYDGTREGAIEIYKKHGYILLYGVLKDGIEMITMITESSAGSQDSRLRGGIPLLTRLDAESEWQTQCGPTVTGIQKLIIEKRGRNMPESRILTIDDFSDKAISIKSARGVHLIDPFSGRNMSDKAFILSHMDGAPHLLSANTSKNLLGFDDLLELEATALAELGFRVFLYKERSPIKQGGTKKRDKTCDIGLCSIN